MSFASAFSSFISSVVAPTWACSFANPNSYGFQNNLDYSGEFLDTLNEYGPQFKAAGYSADEMFNILVAGADAGAWNLDKVGDAAKEFGIRIKDGSTTTEDAMKQMSKPTRKRFYIRI